MNYKLELMIYYIIMVLVTTLVFKLDIINDNNSEYILLGSKTILILILIRSVVLFRKKFEGM